MGQLGPIIPADLAAKAGLKEGDEVEIIGSFLIPEFGVIAVAVLAGVVAMTIVATRRPNLFRTWK